MRRFFSALILLAATLPALAADPPALATLAEQSGFQRTGRYDEVMRLCTAFAERWPAQARCLEFGRTPENRPMLALAVSADGTLDPSVARERKREIVLLQGGIHAGEIDGKDAGFLVLRELLEGRQPRGVLSRVTVLFVPVLNVDGHERFGRWNRPNQRGPEETGWRVTAQNLNLNRDFAKADAPETRAMLKLLDEWDPILLADLHVTDGARFREDVGIIVQPSRGWDTGLGRLGSSLRDEIVQRLGTRGFRALPFYPSFVADDDPASGFSVSVAEPRLAYSYWGLRNRFGVLVETHSWKEYPRRVAITRETILALLEFAARDGRTWREEATAADARAMSIAGQPVTLDYETTDERREIEFAAYEYTRYQSPISGKTAIRYDEDRPGTWRVPLREGVRPSLTVTAPQNGYIVPAAYAALVGERLALHGIRFEQSAETRVGEPVQTFRAEKVTFAAKPYEGRTVAKMSGEWRPETRDIPAGSLHVPVGQPKARLVMSLLEPGAPDSFASWGFFNVAFEQREYMEEYVAETVAQDMLQKDAELRQAFEARLASDPAFAADPAARLDFFRRRHPSWDDRFNLYPVYRF